MSLLNNFSYSIRTKLIVFIVLPILLFFVITMFLTLSKVSTSVKEQIEQDVITQARNYAAILDSEFNSIARLTKINAGIVQNNFNKGNFISILNNTVKNNKIIYGAGFVLDSAIGANESQGNFFYVSRNEDKMVQQASTWLSQQDVNSRHTWYADIKKAQILIWTEPYKDDSVESTLIVTVAAPVYFQGTVSGASFIDIDLKQLQTETGLKPITTQAFVISSREGRFVSHPNPDFIMQKLGQDTSGIDDADLLELSSAMLSGVNGQIRVDSLSSEFDEPFVIFYAPISSTGWSFATGLPERELFAFTRSQIKLVLIGISIIILFAIICVIVVANNLTSPLQMLNSAVQRLGKGDLSVNLKDISTNDEIGQLSQSFNTMTIELRHHLEELKKQYAARDAVENELRIARSIQSSLIPTEFPAFPEYEQFELHAINHPASHVAGDFFDFFLLDSCRLFIVIADVSGKGIGPALLMAVCRTHIRNLAAKGEAPAAILKALNGLLLQHEREQPMFVTVFVAEYNIKEGHLCYANGGHVVPYLINKDGIVGQFGEPTGTIVGMLDDAEYGQGEITLNDSDTIVLYTDGILEARLPDGEFFGEQHFMTLLSANADMAAAELCDSALAAVKTYQANKLNDDVTILVLRRLI